MSPNMLATPARPNPISVHETSSNIRLCVSYDPRSALDMFPSAYGLYGKNLTAKFASDRNVIAPHIRHAASLPKDACQKVGAPPGSQCPVWSHGYAHRCCRVNNP